MKVTEIPLSAQNQRITISLALVAYVLTVQWRYAASTWFLDIDDANGVPLLEGLALVSGCDLLRQHPELGIAGQLVMLCDAGTDVPTFENLGTASHLLFVTP